MITLATQIEFAEREIRLYDCNRDVYGKTLEAILASLRELRESRLAEFEQEPSAWMGNPPLQVMFDRDKGDKDLTGWTPLYARKGGSDGTS